MSVLSHEHLVIHFQLNFVLCIIQNWRWQKNCRNMSLKNVVYVLKLAYFHQEQPRKVWISLTHIGIRKMHVYSNIWEMINKNKLYSALLCAHSKALFTSNFWAQSFLKRNVLSCLIDNCYGFYRTRATFAKTRSPSVKQLTVGANRRDCVEKRRA